MSDRPILLQLCPFAPSLEAALARRYIVQRWFDTSDRNTWLAEHASQVRAVATGGHVGIATQLMNRLPALGIVAINGVGFDKVDLDVARQRGIRVTTTPDVLTDDVADLAVGLIVSALREIPAGHEHVVSGAWPYGDRPLGRRVSGKRFGIFGLGRIGAAIASRLTAFGPVAYSDLAPKDVPYAFKPDIHGLAAASDVLILASAATADTLRLIDRDVLDALGPDGVLVNVARGTLVNEEALIDALRDGRIRGAALDVFADEPRVPDTLRKLGNVVLTPHIASATRETRQAMADIVAGNVEAYLDGAPLVGALT